MNQEQLKGSAIDGAVRQALVEVYTLREAGLLPAVSLSLDDDRGLVAMNSARIFQGPEGKPRIEWSDNDMRGVLVQALTTSYSKAETSEASTEEDTLDMNTLEEETAMADQRLTSEDTSLEQGSAQRPPTISEAQFQDVSRTLDDGNSIAQHNEMSRSRNEAETILPGESFSEISNIPLEENVETQALKSERSGPARLKEESSWHRIQFDNEDIKFSVSPG